MNNEEKNLTEEQKNKILAEWDAHPESPPSLKDLTRLIFPDVENVDGRSEEGRLVKSFLATKQIKARGSQEYHPKEKISLSEEHKAFINNNTSTMSFVEIARVLFANDKITNLSQEAKAINEYIKTLSPDQSIFENPEENVSQGYKPPRTEDRAISKINKYVGRPDAPAIDKEKITQRQRKEVQSLIGYLHTYRFTHQMNTYFSKTERDLFESSFVRYTNDKPDLTQEEVDQYIVLSTEVVISSNIQARVSRLQTYLDDTANDSEGRKISMSLVEAINTAQTEYHQSVNRQQKLLDDLKEKRSDRLKKQIKENASILNLVQLWKEEETRIKLLKLADLRKKSLKKEIDRLSTLEEIKGRILGLSEDEALNG